MKLTKYLFFLFICLFFSACSDDKNDDGGDGGDGKDERPETLAWIEDTMREHYYWREEIKKASDLKYTDKPTDFFKSLLFSKDGKNGYHYSTIQENPKKTRGFIQTEKSYGFEFTTVGFPDGIAACILYVLPNTPASGKLKRGDWILSINDKELTSESARTLYGGDEATFIVARWDPNTGKNGSFVNPKQVNIEAACAVEDNPVFDKGLFTSGGKKIGYLVYNHFTAGKEDVDKDISYDDKLRDLSGSFFSGVNEFILDLRYNNGGLLSSAQLLCAILAPSIKLNENFGALQYKYNDPKTQVPFKVNETLKSGKNLNLKRLFVLVSSMSASSSEAVINMLDPFMEVIIIGEKTEGKNVGSREYISEDKLWEMHPIVCQISNSIGFADYSDGFEPDYSKGEAFDYNEKGEITNIPELYDLGNENERLLKIALGLIDGSYTESRSIPSVSTTSIYKTHINSLDRKATNAVIIDIEK